MKVNIMQQCLTEHEARRIVDRTSMFLRWAHHARRGESLMQFIERVPK